MIFPRIAPALLLMPAFASANPVSRDAAAIENLPLAGFVEVTSLEQLGNLVVTDTKLGQSADTVTQRIVVLRSEEIERLPTPNRNLAELMRHTSGQFVNVLSRNDANWGSYAGLGPKYNSYLLDGLPIDAFVDAMSLDSAAIERVEVHKGPASVLYSNYLSMDFVGNQTPLAGTTNFVLKDRIDTPLTRFSAGAGAWATFGGSAYTQGKTGQLSYILSAGHERSDYTPYGLPGSWLQTTQSPRYEKDKFFLKLNQALDRPDHTLSLYYQHTFHQGNMGRPNRDFGHHYDTLNLAYNNTFATDWHLQLKYGERRYDRNFANDAFPASLVLVNNENTRQTIRPLDLTLSHRHGQGALLTLGVDAQWVDYETDVRRPAAGVTAENRAQARSTGYFIQEKIQLEQWILRGGVRRNTLEHDYALLGGNIPATTSARWSKNLWSLGTRYNMAPELAFYANAGSSFMAPAAKQIGGTVSSPATSGELPNPGLRPESGIGRDLGMAWQPTRALAVDVRGFLNTIGDAIVTNIVNAAPSQVRSENAGSARALGFELDARYAPSPDFSLFANLTRTHTRVKDPSSADHDGTEIPFAPAELANAGLSLRLPGNIRASAYYHWIGRYYDSTSRGGRQAFGHFGLVNARLYTDLIHNTRHEVRLTLDLNNLTDRQYRMPFDFRDPGFNAFVGVDVRY
ncbi:TonB-dependent receptor [Zoogloea sp.]|jgi:iron complex outermembrane receptor protein|uniref:TonB-dependent receptor plug domain-containing protein n=1 Tax=Zoogloea sp. TaxID=49181 RepID=UPI002BB2FEB7|nr:TonB-dependent receptor [Zoogloea sp.]HPI59075.1 TonB-dependent receptor [Zoogloea sp.]